MIPWVPGRETQQQESERLNVALGSHPHSQMLQRLFLVDANHSCGQCLQPKATGAGVEPELQSEEFILKVTTPDLQAERAAGSDFPAGHPSAATSSRWKRPSAFPPPPQLRNTALSHLSPPGLRLSGMGDTHKSPAVALGLLQLLKLSVSLRGSPRGRAAGAWGSPT